MDSVSEERLQQVNPILATKVRAMAALLSSHGIYIRVVQGLRTIAQQNAMYAQGRTAPGPIVTKAQGGHSWHNFGLAVDCVPGIRGDGPWKPNWDASSPDFTAMIAAGEAQGLISGSHWKTMPDKPHFQLAQIPVSPDDAHRSLIATQGMQAVWNSISSAEA